MWQLISIKNYPKGKKKLFIYMNTQLFLEWKTQMLPAVLPTSASTKLNSTAKTNPVKAVLKKHV